jgi:hypothetical protein
VRAVLTIEREYFLDRGQVRASERGFEAYNGVLGFLPRAI